MEDLLSGLTLLLSWQNVLLVAIALAAGFIVGVLPGFGGANAAAVILPFSIGLPLEGALLLMVGIYAGASFAGAVPAVLLNVPGEASSAATAIDGYPLAQQGKAELAIGVARMASAVGGALASIIILVVIGPLSRVALLFGAPELFIVALYGLMIIAVLVGEEVWKGIASAALGLLIAAMSVNPMTAETRWTMGFLELYEGVPFAVAIIGLFAFTEMFLLAASSFTSTETGEALPLTSGGKGGARLRELIEGVAETLRHPRILFGSSLLGLGIGTIPGTGKAVASFFSYGLTKRLARDTSMFGKGAREGIVAAEAADSAVVAGTLVPTLTLGIPGSGTAAVMLGALYLHGVQPGPRVMVTNAPEVYAVLWGLLLSCVLILPLGIFLASPLVSLTRLKPNVLVPGVMVVSAVGAFALRNSMFDVGLALVFGVLGLAMRLTGFPIIPMVIALILGPMAERNFLRALRLGRNDLGYFFSSTTAWILWGLLVATIVYSIVRWYRERRGAARQRAPVDTLAD